MHLQQAGVLPTRVSAAAALDTRCCRKAQRHAAVEEVMCFPWTCGIAHRFCPKLTLLHADAFFACAFDKQKANSGCG